MKKSYLDSLVEKGEAVEVKASPEKKARPEAPKTFLDALIQTGDAEEAFQAQRDGAIPDLAILAAQGFSQDGADEAVGALSKVTGEGYKEGRDAYREVVQGARDRQGFAGDVAEIGGNVASSFMVPGLRGGKFVKELGVAAFNGAMSADELEDVPGGMAKSAIVSGVTQVAGKGVEKAFFDQPNKILARTAGARNSDFLKGRGGEKMPDAVAKELDKIGFFRQGEVVFDNQKRRFVPDPSKGRLETFFKPKSLENLHDRAKIAMSNIKTNKDKLLKGKKISSEELVSAVDEGLEEFTMGFDVEQRAKIADSLKEQMFSDLASLGHVVKKPKMPHISPESVNYGDMVVSASGLDTYKGYLGDEVSKSFEKRLREVGLSDEAILKLRDKVDRVLDKVGGVDYEELNTISHKLNLISEDAWQKIARESATGIEKPTLTRGSWWDRAVDMANPAAMGVGRARVGNWLNDGNYVGEAVQTGLKRTPLEVINNNQGRKPQSINIPEELIRTPLPRSTQGLMEKKAFVLAKVAQIMPEMFEAVKDTFDREPERLGEIAQVLSMKAPQHFERDKYNRFDGRILSEKDKAMAIKDTLLRKDISSIEQSKMITKLNQTGEFEG